MNFRVACAILFLFLFLPPFVAAQDKCLQAGRLREIISTLSSSEKRSEDIKLHQELIAASRELSAAGRNALSNVSENKYAESDYEKLKTSNTSRVCGLLNTRGWPSVSIVGREGADAFLFLISKALPPAMQLELHPVVVNAFERREVEPGELMAAYIDRLRLAIGQKQVFGSQVHVRDGFLVLAPIERPATVDERRAEFKLNSLRQYERFLERSYRMPLIRSVMEPSRTEPPAVASFPAAASLSPLVEEEKSVVNLETAFARVDVVVADAVAANAAALEKSDFRIFENDKEVPIETFSKAEAPFDIVLLLDLSGSTADQVGLIRKTTRRFIEMKRPVDRIAIISFHDTQRIVSELETDKEVLLKRLKDIEGRGASYVWDALKLGLEILDQKSDKDRRKAIVMMSDGVDNALTYTTTGSKIGFADLVEAVQYSSTAVFPIYLDTESPNSREVYADARKTLRYLADQSAGNMYEAKKIEDLSGIYDRVLKDVGTVYTLGFTPNEDDPEKWRRLRVEIPSRPGVKLKHRPGYLIR